MPETGIKCTTCEGTALSNHQAIRTMASAAKPSPTPESNRFGRGAGRVQVPLSRARFTAAARARCAINAVNRHQKHNGLEDSPVQSPGDQDNGQRGKAKPDP